jgi:hypothetical protein
MFLFLSLTVFVCNRLLGNSFTTEGARSLGSLCPDAMAVSLGGAWDKVFAEERNKAGLIRQFGAAPVTRFRLYMCGFGGACSVFV